MNNINGKLWNTVYWDFYSVINTRTYFDIPDSIYLRVKTDIQLKLNNNIFIQIKNRTQNFNKNN